MLVRPPRWKPLKPRKVARLHRLTPWGLTPWGLLRVLRLLRMGKDSQATSLKPLGPRTPRELSLIWCRLWRRHWLGAGQL